MKTLKEKIEVMQAALDGEEIEVRNKSGVGEWDIMPMPNFESWHCLDYRIKPKPLEFWVNVYKGRYLSDRYESKEAALRGKSFADDYIKTVKVREVTDER